MADQKSLSIAHLNVRGISKKKDELSYIIHKHRLKIFAITKTFLTSHHPTNLIYINNYTFERRDRGSKHGGGVGMYINDSIPYKRIELLEKILPESITIQVTQPFSRSFLVSCIYRPPNSPSNWQTAFENFVSECYNICPDLTLIGDFNINLITPHPTWHSIISSLHLSQLINKPTRVHKTSATLIDHIYTSQDHNYSCTDVLDIGLSDHSLILTIR